eukprot:6092321-Prorocentrum_lima.AAC.1
MKLCRSTAHKNSTVLPMPGAQAANEYCHTLVDDLSGRLRDKRGSNQRTEALRSRRVGCRP